MKEIKRLFLALLLALAGSLVLADSVSQRALSTQQESPGLISEGLISERLISPGLKSEGQIPETSASSVCDPDSDARSPSALQRHFAAQQRRIVEEAIGILCSSGMQAIRQAHLAKQPLTRRINSRLIQYEPGLPASGMTMFGEDGFLIGREAFARPGEIERTVFHELHRLITSASSKGVSAELAAEETRAAAAFAERAANHFGL